jgi:hypothetical protein
LSAKIRFFDVEKGKSRQIMGKMSTFAGNNGHNEGKDEHTL